MMSLGRAARLLPSLATRLRAVPRKCQLSEPQCRSSSTALAAIFHGVGQPLELREMKLPETLEEGELLVRLEVATICGSDLHTFHGKRTEPMPLILGHEGVGIVERIGTNVFSGSRPRRGAWNIREG